MFAQLTCLVWNVPGCSKGLVWESKRDNSNNHERKQPNENRPYARLPQQGSVSKLAGELKTKRKRKYTKKSTNKRVVGNAFMLYQRDWMSKWRKELLCSVR